MAVRIACDLDGTIADMDAALLREARQLFGDVSRLSALTERQMRRLWDHVRELDDFWCSLDEIEPGTVAQLAAFAALHGWEIIFLTQRPASAGATTQVQTQRWLEAHGFALPSVYVMNGSRGKVAAALGLDVVIDDRPENCLDVVSDSQARALLVWRRNPDLIPPATARLGIEPITSFAEALEILQQITAETTKPEGFVTRLRAVIGL
jgi:hypothetical protein